MHEESLLETSVVPDGTSDAATNSPTPYFSVARASTQLTSAREKAAATLGGTPYSI
jgi:hypothetical protein